MSETFHRYSYRIYLAVFLLLLAFQLIFWLQTEGIKPTDEVLPQPPNHYLAEALSLGDKQFLFRILTNRVAVSGNIFGGYISLREYDYQKLYNWLKLLDSLDPKSDSAAGLAGYYFSSTTKKENNLLLIKYLDEHSSSDLAKNWWWMYQATYIAQHNLKDLDLALKLANKVAHAEGEDVPLWIHQFPAFLYEKQGEACSSFKVIEKILKDNETGVRPISAKEAGFMRYFINHRLSKLQQQKFDPRKCKNL